MKRIALAAVTTLVLIAALLALPNAPANAAVSTTIAGPDQVAYYTDVAITGTSAPSASVTVYFRATGSAQFVARRTVSADSSGHWSTSYYAASDDEYYAVAGGVASPAHRTALVTATCTTSGPAFKALPMAVQQGDAHYAAFTATRNGEWAGVAFTELPNPDLAVITWRPGQALTVVDRIQYTKLWGYWGGYHAAVDVAGITGDGTLVGSIQQDAGPGAPIEYAAVAWSNGQRHILSHDSAWTSFRVAGVSDSGVIAGWAQLGTGSDSPYIAVTWAGPNARFKVIADVGNVEPSVGIDGAGDVAVLNDSTTNAPVYLASGSTAQLGGFDAGSAAPLVGAGPYLVGGDPAATTRWNPAHQAAGVVPAEPLGAFNDYVVSAGPRGDVIVDEASPRKLRTAGGALVQMPSEYDENHISLAPEEAIDAYGRVAFTSAKDGLPHFLTCTTVTAQNDGRPVAGSTAADVNGDGRADLLATRPDGSLWYYRNSGDNAHPFSGGTKIGTGWGSFTKLTAADTDGNGRADLLAVKSDGSLWQYRNTGNNTHPYSTGSKIGTGWSSITKLTAADTDGNGRADLLAVKSDGSLWQYRNTGNNTHPYSTGSKIGTGWGNFDKLTAADVDGDGHADLLATRPDGSLWYYRNTGNNTHPYSTGTKIGTGWGNFDKLIAGDTDGDGHADLLVTRPFGTLAQYRNTGTASHPYSSSTQIGLTGWQAFDRIF